MKCFSTFVFLLLIVCVTARYLSKDLKSHKHKKRASDFNLRILRSDYPYFNEINNIYFDDTDDCDDEDLTAFSRSTEPVALETATVPKTPPALSSQKTEDQINQKEILSQESPAIIKPEPTTAVPADEPESQEGDQTGLNEETLEPITQAPEPTTAVPAEEPVSNSESSVPLLPESGKTEDQVNDSGALAIDTLTDKLNELENPPIRPNIIFGPVRPKPPCKNCKKKQNLMKNYVLNLNNQHVQNYFFNRYRALQNRQRIIEMENRLNA